MIPNQSQRKRRIADLILRNLALIFKREINDPRLTDVALISADVAPDLSQAKIYFSIVKVEDARMATTALNNASGYLRTLLAKACTLRYTPRLIFIYDDSIDRAERMHHLLEQLEPRPIKDPSDHDEQ